MLSCLFVVILFIAALFGIYEATYNVAGEKQRRVQKNPGTILLQNMFLFRKEYFEISNSQPRDLVNYLLGQFPLSYGIRSNTCNGVYGHCLLFDTAKYTVYLVQ